MTILGKLLLFLVLVLSLVWTGLTVNAYVTRTNWANDAKKWQDQAKAASDSANYQRKLAEDVRNAAGAQLAVLRNEVAGLTTARETLSREVAAAQKQLADKTAADQLGDPQAKLLQANIARLQKQVDLLQASLNTMEKTLNDAVVAAEKSKGDALKASIDRDAALRRADDLELRLQDAMDRYTALRTGQTGRSARTAPPEDLRATVTKVTGDLVEINLGENAKLQKGAQLSIWRGSKYLGSMTLTFTDPFGAVGQFKPPTGVTRPNPADLPKEGDTVGVLKQ